MTPQNQQTPTPTYEELRKRSKGLQKRILIIVGSIFLVLLLTLGAVLLIQSLKKTPSLDGDYYFYPTYQGDIMENEEYLKLNREIFYCDDPNGYGLTSPIDEALYKTLDPAAQLSYHYLQSIMAGDHTRYNSYFDEDYLKKHGEQAEFSQQMLHNITIYLYRYSVGEGNVKTYTYKLNYMFYHNDGTFRRDVGSDSIRPQFLTIEVYPDGSAKIVDMALYNISGNVDLD